MREIGPWPMPRQDSWFSLRIFALAVVGSLMIIFVVFAATFGMGPIVGSSDTINLVCATCGILGIPLAFFLPRLLVDGPSKENVQSLMVDRTAANPEKVEETFQLYKSRTVMGMAFLEGSAMLNATMFFMVGFQAVNLLAFLVVAPAMLLNMPTQNRWWNWLTYMTKHSQTLKKVDKRS